MRKPDISVGNTCVDKEDGALNTLLWTWDGGVDLTCFVHTVGIFLDACFTDCDPGHAWTFTSKLAEASKFWGSYLEVSVHKLDGVNS